MNEIEKVIKEILSRYDLSKREGRNAAYEDCIEYAETKMVGDLRCNTFLRTAAQMLEKDPVEFDVIRDIVEMPDGARIDIAYDDRHGFMLTANNEGIEYLIDLLALLAEAPEGEHVHLFNDEDPLSPISFNAVIYHESSEWFKKAEDEVNEQKQVNPARKRVIQPEEIFAVQLVGNLPEDIPVLRDKIYRTDRIIDKVPDYDDEDVIDDKMWRKPFAGDKDRYVCIEITDDYSEDFKLILNLDDSDVIFFKKDDLEHLFG